MKFYNLLTLLSTLAGSLAAQPYYQQPLPMPCTGPACFSVTGTSTSSLQYQDTTVIKSKSGTYYRFSKGNNTGLGLNVVTAPNLSGPWNYKGTVLGSGLRSPCGAFDGHKTSWRWAPEIHYIGGTYYLYYTVEYPGTSTNPTCFDQCVATSKDLSSWTDIGSMGIPTPAPVKPLVGNATVPYVALDGNLLANSSDPQGIQSLYMTFGSYQFGIYGIHLQNLTHVKPNETPQLVIAAQYQNGGNYTEGSYQLVHGSYVYMFYSRGSCCAASSASLDSVYETQVCRAPVGTIGQYRDKDGQDCRTGGDLGWHRKGTTFLYSNGNNGASSTVFAPGSVGVLNDSKNGLIMWYQYQNNKSPSPNIGFGWNYLSFSSDNWPILTSSRVS